jgi:hypothetical protein
MSSHPNVPDQPAQLSPPSFSHAQGNLYGPAPFDGAQIHQDRSSPGLIIAAVALGLALIGVCVKLLLPSAEPVPDTTQPAPVMAIPESAINASGDGWRMKISKRWVSVKVPKSADPPDAIWRTVTSAKVSGLVAIGTDPQPSTVDLDEYLQTSMAEMQAQDPKAAVIASGVFQAPDHAYGRLEYTTKVDGRPVHNVAYTSETDAGFVNVVYSVPIKAFASTVAKVEPFLATAQSK